MSRLRELVLTILALTLVVPAAGAQERSFEVSGSYSFLSYNNCCLPGDASLSKGWTATAAVDLVNWLSVVGEGSGDYFSTNTLPFSVRHSSRIHSVLGGPRMTSRIKDFKLFGQVLIGATHRGSTSQIPSFDPVTSGEYFVLYQPGVGVDVVFSRHVALRFSADYRMTDLPGPILRSNVNNQPRFSEGTLNEPRFSFGLVWRP